MAQGVNGGRLGDAGGVDGGLEIALQALLVEVMAVQAGWAGIRNRELAPAPLLALRGSLLRPSAGKIQNHIQLSAARRYLADSACGR